MQNRMTLGLVLALVLIVFVRHGTACLQTYGEDQWDSWVLVSKSLKPAAYVQKMTTKRSRDELLARVEDFKRRAAEKPNDLELRNDYAVMLVHAGEFTEALAMLNDIEATNPGRYATASNLGTVYELNGDVEKALHWIKEGLVRNPDSHTGSEWLHVQILRTKQELAKDPDWLKKHSVLGLKFGQDARPVSPSTNDLTALGKVDSLRNLELHLHYQLHERVPLVDPPDAIVGDLLFDLGNVLALNGKLEHAVAVYELAQKYEPPHAGLMQLRKDYFQQRIRWSEKPIGVVVAVIVIGIGITSLLVRRVIAGRRTSARIEASSQV